MLFLERLDLPKFLPQTPSNQWLYAAITNDYPCTQLSERILPNLNHSLPNQFLSLLRSLPLFLTTIDAFVNTQLGTHILSFILPRIPPTSNQTHPSLLNVSGPHFFHAIYRLRLILSKCLQGLYPPLMTVYYTSTTDLPSADGILPHPTSLLLNVHLRHGSDLLSQLKHSEKTHTHSTPQIQTQSGPPSLRARRKKRENQASSGCPSRSLGVDVVRVGKLKKQGRRGG